MNQQNETSIIQGISLIYATCIRQPTAGMFDIWLEEIANDKLDFENCMNALRILYKQSKPGGFPPSYNDFLKIAKPRSAITERDEGVLLATQLISALSQHDYVWPMNGGYDPYPTFKESFIAELGEFAWEVLKQYGGYQRLHDHWVESGENFRPQLRDFITSLRARERAGLLNTKIEMTETKQISNKNKMKHISQIFEN